MFLARADQALYAAKQAGHNRVAVAARQVDAMLLLFSLVAGRHPGR